VHPLNNPLTPYVLIIERTQSDDLGNNPYLSSCILHFTSYTGDTMNEFTKPANAPFYIPSTKLS